MEHQFNSDTMYCPVLVHKKHTSYRHDYDYYISSFEILGGPFTTAKYDSLSYYENNELNKNIVETIENKLAEKNQYIKYVS